MRATALRCNLRTMEPADITQVLDIERRSFPTMWPQTVYERELKNRMARYIVACERHDATGLDRATPAPRPGAPLLRWLFPHAPPPPAGRILGSIGVWFMVGQAHIVTVSVHPDSRRHGIGELLLTAAIEAAIEAQQEDITLEYRISNAAARALYDKYGFQQVGVRARYYTDNHEDAVLMTTPMLRSGAYHRLLAQRIDEQRARWGADYPLEGRLPHLDRG